MKLAEMVVRSVLIFLSSALIVIALLFTLQLPPLSGKYPEVKQFSSLNAQGIIISGYTSLYVGQSGEYLVKYTSNGFCEGFTGEFLVKNDLNGNLVWERTIGSNDCSNSTLATGIAGSPEGVFLVGSQFYGSFSEGDYGKAVSWVQQFDPNSGETIWKHSFTTNSTIQPSSGTAFGASAETVSVAQSGIYVAGGAVGRIISDTPSAQNQPASNEASAFIQKYDLNGTLLWSQRIQNVKSITGVYATDEGVYFAGHGLAGKCGTNGTLIWTQPISARTVSGDQTGIYFGGSLDRQGLIEKYSFNGDELWTREIPSPTVSGAISDLSVSTGNDAVYAAGGTYAALPGQTFTGPYYDAFVRKYSTNGAEEWTAEFPGNENALYASTNGIFVAGNTNGGGAYLMEFSVSSVFTMFDLTPPWSYISAVLFASGIAGAITPIVHAIAERRRREDCSNLSSTTTGLPTVVTFRGEM